MTTFCNRVIIYWTYKVIRNKNIPLTLDLKNIVLNFCCYLRRFFLRLLPVLLFSLPEGTPVLLDKWNNTAISCLRQAHTLPVLVLVTDMRGIIMETARGIFLTFIYAMFVLFPTAHEQFDTFKFNWSQLKLFPVVPSFCLKGTFAAILWIWADT